MLITLIWLLYILTPTLLSLICYIQATLSYSSLHSYWRIFALKMLFFNWSHNLASQKLSLAFPNWFLSYHSISFISLYLLMIGIIYIHWLVVVWIHMSTEIMRGGMKESIPYITCTLHKHVQGMWYTQHWWIWISSTNHCFENANCSIKAIDEVHKWTSQMAEERVEPERSM